MSQNKAKQDRGFPTFLYQGPGATWFGKNSSLTFKIGKTGLEELKCLSNIQKHGKLYLRTIKIFWTLFLEIFIKIHHKPYVINPNFVIFGAIFMKISPKCNKSHTLGNLLLSLGISASVWGKIGADYRPQICPRKIPARTFDAKFTSLPLTMTRLEKLIPISPFCWSQA